MTTETTSKRKTPLKNVVTSARNLAVLEEAGIKFVEDLEGKSLEDLAALGIGQLTMEKLIAARGGKIKPRPQRTDVDESDDPLVIQSPFFEYCLQVLPGGGTRLPSGGMVPIQPIYIVCTAGRGQLTQEMWLNRVYQRDDEKVRQHMSEGKPWRKQAYEWLRTRKGFLKKRYIIMTD